MSNKIITECKTGTKSKFKPKIYSQKNLPITGDLNDGVELVPYWNKAVIDDKHKVITYVKVFDESEIDHAQQKKDIEAFYKRHTYIPDCSPFLHYMDNNQTDEGETTWVQYLTKPYFYLEQKLWNFYQMVESLVGQLVNLARSSR
jgi:hypothetical protein